MRSRRDALVSLAALLLVTAVAPGARPGESEEVPGPVPAPSAVAQMAVRAGQVYPFPWSGVADCPARFQPGCFLVKEVGADRVVLTYARVVLEAGRVKPQGFRYRTPVSAGGSPYELFAVKIDAVREEWVYAIVDRAEGQVALMRFLKLPAFVSERARLAVRTVVEAGWQRLREDYTVEADEPLTLIGLGRLDAVFPSARLEAIEIDGRSIRFPYTEFVHLNLPPGRHQVSVVVALPVRPTELTLWGTLLEPRRMSLVRALDLRVERAPGTPPPELEVRTVGLPPEVWDRFRATLVVTPAVAQEASALLAVRYRFSTADAVTLSALPRIPVGPNNYPVMITIRDSSR